MDWEKLEKNILYAQMSLFAILMGILLPKIDMVLIIIMTASIILLIVYITIVICEDSEEMKKLEKKKKQEPLELTENELAEEVSEISCEAFDIITEKCEKAQSKER